MSERDVILLIRQLQREGCTYIQAVVSGQLRRYTMAELIAMLPSGSLVM